MMDVRTFLATPTSILAPVEHEEQCAACDRPLGGESEYTIDKAPVHEDCYFDVFGELAEHQHPRAGQ